MGGAMQIARRLPFPSETTSSKRVFTEISTLVRGSNIRLRGRSFAASVPSNSPEVKKSRKRLSKAERKAMVESFVNKYRSINLGKFPTVSYAKKEVGGSYYFVREILQELEYKSKFCSVNTRDETSLGKGLVKENKSSTKVEGVSSSQITMDAVIHKDAETVADNGVETGDFHSNHFEVKKKPQISILVDNAFSEEVGKPTGASDDSTYIETQSHLLKEEAEEVLCSHPEKLEANIKNATPSENVLDFDVPNPKAEQHQRLHESERFARRDLPEEQIDEELQKKSSMWGNLKSLADGIINIWRKL